jgi:hypothetical protein
MADQYLSPTPYANPLTGYSNDLIQGLLGYMKDKQRTQQMQGLAGLLESTGIPQSVERSAYAQSPKALLDALTNVNRANVPLLKSETADALMTLLPIGGTTAKAAERGAMAAGRAAERVAEKVVPQVMERGGLPAQLLGDLAEGSRSQALPTAGRSGFGEFDVRYDPRVLEQARMQNMIRDVQLDKGAVNAPSVSLADFEGRSFITSMADRTAAGGKLVGIDNVQFNRPVEFLGGQDFMFRNPGLVWSSGKQPSKALMKYADEIYSATGENPIYMPYRMAPTGGDFAQMTGESMLSYADAAMGKTQKKSFDKSIKKFIPDWAGVSDPKSVDQFRAAPDKTRKAIKQMMDRDFRNEGGLNIGSARLSVSDPAQLNAQEGGVQNVGEIFAGRPIVTSSHPAYPGGVQGQGIGTLKEDLNIFELLPEVVKARKIADPRNPSPADLRAMQMRPYAGVISSGLLKSLGY